MAGVRLAMASIVSTGVSTTLVQHAAQLLIVSTTFVGGIIFLHVVGGKERGLIVSENGQREQQRIINPTRRPPISRVGGQTDPALIGWQRLGGGGHAAFLWKTDRIGNAPIATLGTSNAIALIQ